MRCAGTRDAPHPSDVHERRSPSPSQPLANARLGPAQQGRVRGQLGGRRAELEALGLHLRDSEHVGATLEGGVAVLRVVVVGRERHLARLALRHVSDLVDAVRAAAVEEHAPDGRIGR